MSENKYEGDLEFDKKSLIETFDSCYKRTEYKIHNEVQALFDYFSDKFSFQKISLYQIGPVIDGNVGVCSPIQLSIDGEIISFEFPVNSDTIDAVSFEQASHSVVDYSLSYLFSLGKLKGINSLSFIPCDRNFLPNYTDPRLAQKSKVLKMHMSLIKNKTAESKSNNENADVNRIQLLEESNKDLQNKLFELMELMNKQMEINSTAKPVRKPSQNKSKKTISN